MGGNGPCRHRAPGFHHQAPVLRRCQEEVPVRYNRIVSFDPYEDGFGIMRDAQTFRTGDGWFPYNLAVNLAQAQG